MASYFSPDGSQCLIVNLDEAVDRYVGDGHEEGQYVEVGISDGLLPGGFCEPAETWASVGLGADDYRIHALTAAYVVASLQLDGHEIDLDIAWVATGGAVPVSEPQEQHPGWSFVGKDAPAHLTGTVLIDDEAWVAQQGTATLRDQLISKNY